ncbi:hypothetical protein ACFL22_00315 [Patescibacteria group bacterium]
MSIVLVAVFGVFSFDMAMHGGDMDCPLAVFSGGACSAMTTAFATTLHHIAGFQSLMQSAFSSNVSLLILSLIVFASLVILFRCNNKECLELNTEPVAIFRTHKKIQPNRFAYMMQKWFVLIKNKDNFPYALAYETSV